MILLLTGTNDFLRAQALDALLVAHVQQHGTHSVERIGGEELEPTRLAELLQGASLFSAERLVVLRDASKNKAVWEALDDWLPRVPAETTLIIIEPAPDKRTRTYKTLAKLADTRSFDELPEHALLRWLGKAADEAGGRLDTKAAAYLLQKVGTDQWRLWHELHKLVQYQAVIDKQAIDMLVEPTPQASVFDLLDAALGRQTSRVQELLDKLAHSEDPYKLFGLLVAQVHALAVVKAAGTIAADTIAKDASLHPFVVRKTQTLARATSQAEVQQIIDAVAVCDVQLKSVSVGPWVLLAQCLGKIAAR